MSHSVLIIDGTALAYRAFYALRDLSTRDGRPVNALFGFIRMIRQLTKHWRPERVIVTFDGGSPAHRLEKCPEYKAQRAPMPDDLRRQLPWMNEYLAAVGIPMVLLKGQEADDVMATLATRAADAGADVRLVTSDKDLMQLVSERIRIVPPSKTQDEKEENGVVAKTGVKPEQIVDWLALIGDTSDNIPGIMGVGPKSAAKLLQQFGSLEECLARSDEIEPAGLREKIQAGRATAELNVELMELDRAVPGVPEWEEIPAPMPDLDKMKSFFETYELRQFAALLAYDQQVPSVSRSPRPPKPAPKPADDGQMSLF